MIHGINVDKQGRCAHYYSARDVVGNKCVHCDDFWACYKCHNAMRDHEFGQMAVDAPESVICGACGHLMGYDTYGTAAVCPGCGHDFNPGCAAHAGIYFER
mgnify:CR=1 FL=1